MIPDNGRGRHPGHQVNGLETPTKKSDLIVPQGTDDRRTLDSASLLAGVYVTVVRVNNGHMRRRVYLSLAPAERAVRSAQERGHSAEIVLCRLDPVGGALE